MQLPTLNQADLKGKKVLLRAGFDVPIEDGQVHDTTRIDAIMPTMKHILDSGASLIIMAHQGRPKGEPNPEFSQKPLVVVLEKLLGVPVKFAEKCDGDDAKQIAQSLQPGEVLLLENLRFEKGEKSKDQSQRDLLGQSLAALADVYVNDAFTNCHRDHASMTSVPKFMVEKYMGLNVQKEVEGLSKVNQDPAQPVTLIISGLKMETKIPVIQQFLDRGDNILVGGGVANTLLKARGFDLAKSRYDEDFLELAQELMLESEQEDKAKISVPCDGIVATRSTDDAEKLDVPLEDIEGDMAMYDIGTVTLGHYIDVIKQSKTIVWNGPMGMYEVEGFSNGTKNIAEAVKEATAAGAVSIVGGGDTLDFHERYGYSLDAYTFVSTAGGAMLDFISGKELPALEALCA
ncbi:phosphoglycerate kinase [bacterium]|nr:phosphoglycerate kinase [bacterium]|tara:strand:+ start:7538 stop:8746 length:1209 start_codon:yes stop_codon:yes gene_type:complete